MCTRSLTTGRRTTFVLYKLVLYKACNCKYLLKELTLACCSMQKKSRTDKNAKEVDPTTPAFTRRREVFAGRLAMAGFAASLIGEVGFVLKSIFFCARSSVHCISYVHPRLHNLGIDRGIALVIHCCSPSDTGSVHVMPTDTSRCGVAWSINDKWRC